MKYTKYALFFLVILCLLGCDQTTTKNDQEVEKEEFSFQKAPVTFSGDSAFVFIEKQLEFGPRVPGSKGHQRCGDWIIEELGRYNTDVIVQDFEAKAFNQQTLQGRNIIGSINPQARKRILLAAHWDTRPFADQEGEEGMNFPIPGANDGGSGVAVLLEIARVLADSVKPEVGIDLLFFDLEDYGAPEGVDAQDSGWCLGSRHWSQTPHKNNYMAYYGILLDMVGAEGATFTKEGHSVQFAPKVVDLIWKHAESLGLGGYFQKQKTDPIIDDHYFVNTIRKIPMIDIIHYDAVRDTPFFEHWHTRTDDLSQIDPATLQAVGQTVLQALFNE